MTQNTHITVNEGGISSGFTQLDRITGGWQPSNLIVIASRPSMGKTAFALSMARNMAIDMGYGVAFFSLEMSAQYLLTRMIVAETEFDGDRIRPDNLAEEVKSQLDAQTAKLANAPIYIDDTPALSALEIGVACERLVQQHGIHVAIIDYFQRMGDYHCCAEDANIIRSLKATAKKLNIPVIVFSQLYRVFKRSERRKPPQLADLMCSDAIEQNADIVMFIHRPEQDGFTEDCEGNDLRGYAEITVARHRNGALGSVGLRFKKEFAKFVELEEPAVIIRKWIEEHLYNSNYKYSWKETYDKITLSISLSNGVKLSIPVYYRQYREILPHIMETLEGLTMLLQEQK